MRADEKVEHLGSELKASKEDRAVQRKALEVLTRENKDALDQLQDGHVALEEQRSRSRRLQRKQGGAIHEHTQRIQQLAAAVEEGEHALDKERERAEALERRVSRYQQGAQDMKEQLTVAKHRVSDLQWELQWRTCDHQEEKWGASGSANNRNSLAETGGVAIKGVIGLEHHTLVEGPDAGHGGEDMREMDYSARDAALRAAWEELEEYKSSRGGGASTRDNRSALDSTFHSELTSELSCLTISDDDDSLL